MVAKSMALTTRLIRPNPNLTYQVAKSKGKRSATVAGCFQELLLSTHGLLELQQRSLRQHHHLQGGGLRRGGVVVSAARDHEHATFDYITQCGGLCDVCGRRGEDAVGCALNRGYVCFVARTLCSILYMPVNLRQE